jgi:uncharacterized damage-inducible protein DinB
MSVAQMLLPEFDNEMKTTRRVLERVPEDKMGWQPHEKSMTLGRLAGHLAELAGWGAYTLENDSLDLAPGGVPSFKPLDSRSRQEVLDVFDANVKKTRAALEQASDDSAFGKPWTLQMGERVIFTLPRGAVLRTMLFSHIVHHRGQLSVYLRLNDVPVPSIYGPSADEQ